ncbi:MAG TPA: family 10 glycosylhydrolase [Usitatibacteraceae bacterium]|nr:family 10 glycosylhydrolase [Usitatibacteraceae bacterium]
MTNREKANTGAAFGAFSARNARQCLGLLAVFWMVALGSCTSVPPAAPEAAPERAARGTPQAETAPPAPREFRAAWVATVANIDWPSRRGLTTAEQQAEAIEIIGKAQALGLNALIFQVRPSADALYESALEPWSEYLTGEQGRAPAPYYDPLQFWIDESHKRGIELHAWFNPYRARHTAAKAANAASHIANTHPPVVKSYGGFLWMDPGEPISERRTLDVILDVVRRYDIDGVHIDDYFYPYPVTVPGSMPPVDLEFPDEGPWNRWLAQGGANDRAAWRRGNVNRLVESIHAGIKKEKPWVRFGVSPFGIGKPENRPPGISGFSQYDKIFADVELWLQQGWMDYLAPQLYWPIAQREQAFEVLLDQWHRENTAGRHIFPGLYTSRIDASEKSWMPGEITDQIARVRARRAAQGHIHFSAVALKENRRGINDELLRNAYGASAGPALPPAAPWLSTARPAPPEIDLERARASGGQEISVVVRRPESAWRLGTWVKARGVWSFRLWGVSMSPEDRGGHAMVTTFRDLPGAIEAVVASTFDRYGTESERVQFSAGDLSGGAR